MKNLIFLFALLIAGLTSFAQGHGSPIQTYNEDGYSVAKVNAFALGLNSSVAKELVGNYRKELLQIVNEGLKKAGYNLVLNETHISWIFNQVVYENVSLSSFTNSCKNGNSIVFFSTGVWQGEVGIFVYKDCRIILYKTICMNLIKNAVEIGIIKTVVKNQQQNPIIVVQNQNQKQKQQQQQQPPISNSTFTVRSGGTFIPDQQQWQQSISNSTFTVRSGGSFWPNCW